MLGEYESSYFLHFSISHMLSGEVNHVPLVTTSALSPPLRNSSSTAGWMRLNETGADVCSGWTRSQQGVNICHILTLKESLSPSSLSPHTLKSSNECKAHPSQHSTECYNSLRHCSPKTAPQKWNLKGNPKRKHLPLFTSTPSHMVTLTNTRCPILQYKTNHLLEGATILSLSSVWPRFSLLCHSYY